MQDDLKRYIVQDGFAYFTGEPTRKENIHKAGSILVLTDAQVEKQKQAHKLALCEEVVVRCNNAGCGKTYATKVVQIQHAVCSHCGGRGGELIGPTPVAPAKLTLEDNKTTGNDGDGTGDSASLANDSAQKSTDNAPKTAEPADTKVPVKKKVSKTTTKKVTKKVSRKRRK